MSATKKIAVLGYTFKQDTDDIRDSLVPKLVRYIDKMAPGEISICEPNIKSEIINGLQNYEINNFFPFKK